jgi:hypothetical protein
VKLIFSFGRRANQDRCLAVVNQERCLGVVDQRSGVSVLRAFQSEIAISAYRCVTAI